jgi:tripartite-type tricarboxylate transporter receptor subunit TctC
MSRTRFRISTLLSISFCIAIPACAQSYPSKPIRLITNAAGGGNDFIARLVAPPLAERLGQPVVVDNRPAGSLPAHDVAEAPADGYTLLVSGGTFWIGTLLRNDLPYEVSRDFAPVTLLATSPNILVVHPSLPVKRVQDLVALAKAKPGVLNYGSPSIGAAQHLAAELMKSMAHVNIVRVAYRGTSAALMATISGEVDLDFAPASSAPIIKARHLRALAITDGKRSAFFPELPTMAECGFPGYEANSMQGVFAPIKTSPATVDRLYREIASVLNRDDIRQRLATSGIEAGGIAPAAFGKLVQSEMTRMGKVIRDANIHVN